VKLAFANILLDPKKIGSRILSFEGVEKVVNKLIDLSIMSFEDVEKVVNKLIDLSIMSFEGIFEEPRPGLLKAGKAPGQFVADLEGNLLAEILPYVSSGDGKHTGNTEDYVVRRHWSGRAMLCLKRERAEVAKEVRLIIDTRDAYLADPDVVKDAVEQHRIETLNPDFVVVWIVAASASTEMSGGTLLRNLAGANNEALLMTADEIRAQAAKSQAHDETWLRGG